MFVCLHVFPGICVKFTVVVKQGIYPDLLHILDLTIFPDLYASSLMVWTDNQNIFVGRSRDDRLQQIYLKYFNWCVENRCLTASCSKHGVHNVEGIYGSECMNASNLGIPNGCRARAILFLRNSLQPKNNAYPAVGQKKLNGASSRLMINFFAEISVEIHQSHPCDVHK